MLKVLIADDEPLVQIGLKSMIDWNRLGFELCPSASNGEMAFEIIETHMPEIVITDIQMPRLSGLELAKKCRDTYGRLPVFIILTSYEDFNYAREAISFQAIDYLIKIDLTPELLTDALTAARNEVEAVLNRPHTPDSEKFDAAILSNRFFVRLINHLFDNQKQVMLQADALSVRLDYRLYCTAQIEIIPDKKSKDDHALYSSTLHMFEKLIEKYTDCRILPLDNRFFAVLFYSDDGDVALWKEHLSSALTQTFSMLYSYYSVTLLAVVGRTAANIMDTSASYYDARQIAPLVSAQNQILFFDDLPDTKRLQNVFHLSLFRRELSHAFEELDETVLHETISDIIELFPDDDTYLSQAIDVSQSILRLTLTLLSNGAELADKIFADEPDGYRSLCRKDSVRSVLCWLDTLQQGLCLEFRSQSESQINASKKLLLQPDLKLYEIARESGFENAFYYSKAFKRITGISPKEYIEQAGS